MKICKLLIPNFQQFKNIELDFTYPKNHPKAGEPLDKVCFIGTNGTGKSTILEVIASHLQNNFSLNKKGTFIFKLKLNQQHFHTVHHNSILSHNQSRLANFFLPEDVTINQNWIDALSDQKIYLQLRQKHAQVYQTVADQLKFSAENDVVVYIPPESPQNDLLTIQTVPKTNLDEALKFKQAIPYFHLLSNSTIKDFWKLLISLVKKRENDYLTYQKHPDNQNKTIKQFQQAFDEQNPEILQSLSKLWNKILNKAGLFFDYEDAKHPVQLTDNLEAYIKTKNNNQTIPYRKLSTGLRNFIFRLGHIYTLYFNKQIKQGFLLVDEPENSLFPDFLYDLIDIYLDIIKNQNTQFFVATHNPIIAAQFEPYERIILDFDDNGQVTARRGITPVGDDPNDILLKDFGVRSLLGKKGVEMWERFIELKILIKNADNETEKSKLLDEYMNIGNLYNFSP